MGSLIRAVAGVAAAMLIQTGLAAAPPTAEAKQVVIVPCSTSALITAINTANAAGSGTLRLASSCTYLLTTAAGAGRGPDGLPVITGTISLIGGRSTSITRSASAPNFRIIEVAAGAALFVRNILISGGVTDATVPGNDTGGGILNSRGNILLLNTMVSGNVADNGAGISNDSGRVRVFRSIVSANTTRAGGGGGGGIYNDGSLLVATSLVTGNRANTNGGGIYNGEGGRAETFRTIIRENVAGANGGGVFNAADGRLVLRRTLVTRNTAANGGGIFNAGVPSRVVFLGSLITANTPNNCAPLNTIAGCVG
jgi:hypothetical protein